MPTNTYNGAGLTQRTLLYAERDMLNYANAVVVLDKFGLKKHMPRNKSETIVFRRPVPLTKADTPLVEGVTPSATQFQYENVQGTLKQYGQVSDITDKIEDLHEDPVMQDLVRQLGENIGRTREALCWAAFRAGTNVFYMNGTARNQVNTALSLEKLRKAVRSLKNQKARKITSMLSSSPNYATKAIPACYIAVAHTDLESDIRNLPGFIPCEQYGSRDKVSDYEIGAVEDLRIILSPDLESYADAGGTYNGSGSAMISTTGTNADIYPMLIFGEEAFGTVTLRGMGAISPTIIPVGQRDKTDPLGQIGKAGWKMYHEALILNETWMIRLEAAATEL